MGSYPLPPTDPRTQRRLLRDQARLQRQQLRSLRPTSMLGPILLVGIGVVALLVELGHIRMPLVFNLFAHWWPLLLVAAGLIRFAEWIADQSRRRRAQELGQVAASTSLGSGVVLLLLLLILIGIAAGLSHHDIPNHIGRDFALNEENWDQFLGDKHESDTSLAHPCPDGTVLTIDSPHGDISVAGTSTDGQLHLNAHTTVYTRSDHDAESRSTELSPAVRGDGNQLTIAIPGLDGTRVDLTLTLPAATTVIVHGNQGDVTVSGQSAPVTIIANHGDVVANDINGPIVAHVNNGDSSFAAHNDRGGITLEGRAMDLTVSDVAGDVNLNGDFFGTVHVERALGALRLHTGRIDLAAGRVDGNLELSPGADLTGENLAGPFTLNTRNRNVNLERVSGDISISNRNGSVTLVAAAPLGNVTIENRTGPVDVTLPANAGFTLDATTSDAELNNAFSLRSEAAQSATHLSGIVGDGGPSVHLTTTQGDLSIQRGSNAPLPPVVPNIPKVVIPKIVIPKIVIPQVNTPQVVIPKIVIPQIVVPQVPSTPQTPAPGRTRNRHSPTQKPDDQPDADEKTF